MPTPVRDPAPGAPAPPESASRRLSALLAGGVAGGAVFVLSLGAGYLLYHRLWDGSPGILIAVLLVFAVAGGYAAWLLGVLVFSVSRGDHEDG